MSLIQFKLLLSPCVVPYSNFRYYNVCDPIQMSVITICVTLFKPLSLLCALSNSNFRYHRVWYPIQTSGITTCVTLFKRLSSPYV